MESLHNTRAKNIALKITQKLTTDSLLTKKLTPETKKAHMKNKLKLIVNSRVVTKREHARERNRAALFSENLEGSGPERTVEASASNGSTLEHPEPSGEEEEEVPESASSFEWYSSASTDDPFEDMGSAQHIPTDANEAATVQS